MTFKPGQLVEYLDAGEPLFLALVIPTPKGKYGIHYIRLIALSTQAMGIGYHGWCTDPELLRIIK